MGASHSRISTFPSVRIPSRSGGLPVEVALIAQFGPGSGSQLIEGAAARQRGHAAYIDALDEPSARLGGMDLEHGDATSLYSFAVGAHGHPFHRHAGHRVFTAISGSGGAQLRFSSASQAQVDADPSNFIRALHHVNIPPDSLFTVRFGGGTWHQFAPLRTGSSHPAMFALSCHTNELGGDLPDALRSRVLNGRGDIPSLTEVLPPQVAETLDRVRFDPSSVPTVALALDAPPTSWLAKLCEFARDAIGRVRGAWGRYLSPTGYLNGAGYSLDPSGRAASEVGSTLCATMKRKPVERQVFSQDRLPADSLLLHQFDGKFDHEDCSELTTMAGELKASSATLVMSTLLDGFLENRPQGVAKLMSFRNALVKPLGLRTSPLGCPVSSLLAQQSECWFAGRFPVFEQQVDAMDRKVQVILGADDKHLSFRSCVTVSLLSDDRAAFMLSTRVRNRNLFGRIYMKLIDRVHRQYATPTLLRFAVDHAVRQLQDA